MTACGATGAFKVSALRVQEKIRRRFVGNDLNVGTACGWKILDQVTRGRGGSRLQSDFDGLVLSGDGAGERERAKQGDQNDLRQGSLRNPLGTIPCGPEGECRQSRLRIECRRQDLRALKLETARNGFRSGSKA